MSFSLKKDKHGVVVVGVDGQLIVGNRQDLKQKVLDTLEGGGKKFVIDFTKTGYIDSSGLACWSRSRRRSASKAGTCASRA